MHLKQLSSVLDWDGQWRGGTLDLQVYTGFCSDDTEYVKTDQKILVDG